MLFIFRLAIYAWPTDFNGFLLYTAQVKLMRDVCGNALNIGLTDFLRLLDWAK